MHEASPDTNPGALDGRGGPWARAWRATWKIVVFLTGWGLLYAPVVLWIDPASGADGGQLPIRTRLILELAGAVSILVAAWAALRWLDGRPFRSLGLRAVGAGGSIGLGLGLGVGMIAVVLLAAGLPGWLVWREPVGFSWPTLGLLALAMLLNTVIQEVMARGYVLQTIESGFGVVSALVVSTVFFTALHAGALVEGGVLPAVNLTAAGLLLGLAYITTRSLWTPVALHFAWNVVQGPVLGMPVTGQELGGGWRLVELSGPPIWTGGRFGLEGGLLATMATLAGVAFFVWTSSRREPRDEP